jgi:hypothetical protein
MKFSKRKKGMKKGEEGRRVAGSKTLKSNSAFSWQHKLMCFFSQEIWHFIQ